MSIVECDRCIRMIDPQKDTQCFVEEDLCLCESCRERAEYEADMQAAQINDEERI